MVGKLKEPILSPYRTAANNMNAFELATLETLVSFQAKNEADITRLLNCQKLKEQAKTKVKQWNDKRIEQGLTPWV